MGHPPDFFYRQFRAEAERRIAAAGDGRAVSSIVAEMGEQVGLPACLMARFVIKSFLHENPQTLMNNGSNGLANGQANGRN